MILSRVAALPTSTRTLLAAASVLGQHAPVSTTAAVAGLADTLQLWMRPSEAGLLRQGPGTELTFTHPLYRAAIYADLSTTNRRELHARGVVSGHATARAQNRGFGGARRGAGGRP